MTMGSVEKPNPDNFSRAEYPGEFYAEIRVDGIMRVTIKAAAEDEALKQAEALADRIAGGEEEFEPDDVTDVDVWSVWARPPMFRVMRDGQKMQVSRLAPGDEPRDPDERGF
jgi:hypothetical protein